MLDADRAAKLKGPSQAKAEGKKKSEWVGVGIVFFSSTLAELGIKLLLSREGVFLP